MMCKTLEEISKYRKFEEKKLQTLYHNEHIQF